MILGPNLTLLPFPTTGLLQLTITPPEKKGSAELHDGFGEIHDYPERTPLMGYYDEEDPAVTDWEIK